MNLNSLTTEQRNAKTTAIDEVSTQELVQLINNEDKLVPLAVEKEIDSIAKAIDLIYEAMSQGGRLIYCGAGTSGRLGVLDASECPPTYGVTPDTVVALIAGGEDALLNAVEGAEDDEMLCQKELEAIHFTKKDVLVGIAASGRTPYTIGGLLYAKSIGAKTVSLTCNNNSKMAEIADVSIAPIVGPEVVTGSTRMKAGTAQKLVLNMLSTGTMIKMGKVYQNLMVDVMPSNLKLIERCCRIVMEATGTDYDTAKQTLESVDYHPKTAIVMILGKVTKEEAKKRLEESKGHIKAALK
ncbi:N-acetylmuramic acid 6-phosphate etherase [Paludicola sp. MB14-C6]|uniref:N-acetylmuramic acid 6-phosphate etherase n=1 Tax=Paludihabitans sp. MB14-C6 TaxID=3070656 RepID=UPI0027DD0CA1|nr:N-acetylmuramic acid 6-phosphate etherase [Paludicola sp. MB14-C6]WMJ24389.1 N-acetylmuramic acid 6-phosphate etherase [Paludicola sp. MB14-C6]